MDGSPRTIPAQRVALLGLLVASGDRGVPRDRAAALLWPESPEEKARHSLGQSLYALRRDAASADVVVGTTTLRLNTAVVSCDAWDVESAAQRGDSARVAALYEGPFLDGIHVRGSAELEQLIDAERARLARVHASALESLARNAATGGKSSDAVNWWRRLAAVDPLSSRVALELVRSLVAAGDKTAALQAARVHETLVREELDAEPDPTFVTYADALRRENVPPVVSRAVARERPPRIQAGGSAPVHGPPPNVALFGQRAGLARRFVWGTVATALLGILMLGAQRFLRANSALDPKRVYVAWFENRTGDASLDQIGGMASDWVSQGIERSGVVAVASAARAENTGPAPRQSVGNRDARDATRQAAQLGAGTVVAGAYYKVGDQLRFHVQLSDVARGEVLDAFDAVGGSTANPAEPLEAVRQRAMGSLASLVDPRLSSWVRVATKPPTYEAYREFVTGQSIWGSDHAQALLHFRRAAELDSSFYAARVEAAILHRLLAECDRTEAIAAELSAVRGRLAPYDYYVLDGQVAQCEGDWERAYRQARAVADLRPRSAFLEYSLALQAMQLGRFDEAKALLDRHTLEQGVAEVGPNYAVVHAQVSSVRGDRARGIDIARWVRSRYPSYAQAWAMEATLLARNGRVEETERLIDTMVTQPLAPSSAVVFALRRVAASFALRGDTVAAQRTLTRALGLLDMAPSAKGARQRSDRAQLLYESGRFDQARTLLAEMVAADSGDVDARGYLGLIAVQCGDTATAATIDAWLAAVHPRYTFTRTLYRARMAAVLGSRDRALSLLGIALDETGRFLVPAFREYAEFASIRTDERFERLMTLH